MGCGTSKKGDGKPMDMKNVAKTQGKAAPRILCYGDSLTSGYMEDGMAEENPPWHFYPFAPLLQKQLQDELRKPDIIVDHVGMNGWTTTQMVEGKDGVTVQDLCEIPQKGMCTLLKANKYTHCILLAGSNDLGELGNGIAVKDIAANIRALHKACHVLGVKTLAIEMPGFDVAKMGAGSDKKQVEVNKLLVQYAKSELACTLLEGVNIPYNAHNGDWETDGIHMTKQGYAKWAKRIGDAVKLAL